LVDEIKGRLAVVGDGDAVDRLDRSDHGLATAIDDRGDMREARR